MVVFSSAISLICGSRVLKNRLGSGVKSILAGKPVNCFIIGSALRYQYFQTWLAWV